MENYAEILHQQRNFFDSGATLDLKFRRYSLKKLRNTIRYREKDIAAALASDLHKSPTEAYMTETGMLISSINYTLSNLKKWSKPYSVRTPMALFPGKSKVMKSPYGLCLIAAPWNYPVLLSLEPLVSAIAAGNCAIVKPSEMAPASSALVKQIICETFSAEHVYAAEGGAEVINALLDLKFDRIFFTGSPQKGSLVMKKAAESLTPVTLELGGKSPCIIDDDFDLSTAMRRVVFGKILNAGQTCVAPDYLLVHQKHKYELPEAFATQVKSMMGEHPLKDKSYTRIINNTHFKRLVSYLQQGKILSGGEYNVETLQLSPTLLEISDTQQAVMQEEIFGPVLPVLYFSDIQEAIFIVRQLPNPLALYIFTNNRKHEKTVLESLSFGDACVNDCIMQLASPRLPFGGVGKSGMGYSHGKYGFDEFSHLKAVLRKPSRIDVPLRYKPYTALQTRLIKMFLR